MSDPLDLPRRPLSTQQAARWLGLSGRTLEKHRCFGTGPTYRKLGGRVMYLVTDLQIWVDESARVSTSGRAAKRTGMAAPGLAERRTFDAR